LEGRREGRKEEKKARKKKQKERKEGRKKATQMPVAHTLILATQEAEIRRITVQSQPRQIVSETLFQKSPSQKTIGGVAQGVGPEFKPQHCNKYINK
jgi:hypothetical protein